MEAFSSYIFLHHYYQQLVFDNKEFIVFGVLLLVGSWCDKVWIARELEKGCEVLEFCVRESYLTWEIYFLGEFL